jgi:hypothetical protein
MRQQAKGSETSTYCWADSWKEFHLLSVRYMARRFSSESVMNFTLILTKEREDAV